MSNETISLENATNILPVLEAVNNDVGGFLIGGFLLLIFIILLAAFSVYGIRNGLLASSAITSLIGIFLFALGLLHLYLITFLMVLSIGSIILRVFGGD